MTDHAPGPMLRFAGVSLDCADPAVLADFYLALLGGETLWQSAGSVGIRVPGVVLAMQRVEEYRRPAWPGSSVVHLDLTAGGDAGGTAARAVSARAVSARAVSARAVSAGAVLADYQPDPRWRVLLDPAGHPFCITTITPPDHPLD
jgi:Glyoxalase-like domain